jgi:sulfur carrier protein
MKVTILPERETRELQAENVGDLLAALKLHQDAHLVVRGDDILTRDVRLAESDEVEIWPVISGGSRP